MSTPDLVQDQDSLTLLEQSLEDVERSSRLDRVLDWVISAACMIGLYIGLIAAIVLANLLTASLLYEVFGK